MKIIYRTTTLGAVLALIAFGLMPAALAQNQRPYRYNDTYMRQVIQRLESKTNRFSNLLPKALDRSRINGTNREDDVNKFVRDFAHATDMLKERFNNHQSSMADAQTVLQEGARIDTFMRNHQLDYRTESAWTQVKTELDRLANSYSVARNWNTMEWPAPTSGRIYADYNAMLTGTFRLNTNASNNPQNVANNATRNLPYRDRQSVLNNLMNRLTPPEMISVERHGNSVTLASTRSPQVTFDVDGQERMESYPGGRNSHVRATWTGGELKIVSNGDRTNDFTATFVPVDNGRRLLVTREIYAERLARPVMVQSYYDRTSDVAQWNVYNGDPTYPSGNTTTNFVVPDGTQLMAVLSNDLSTRNTRDNGTFTMRVTSPAAYEGAVLDGYVTGVSRSGRLSGRSGMTFNFNRITMRNGEHYRFAGMVNNVRMLNGESVRVDNEGAVSERDSQTNTTIERAGIGTAIGALIGAIAGGGKGAAIGAVLGAGTGAGSVYVQGRDDLELMRGSEFDIRSSSPTLRN